MKPVHRRLLTAILAVSPLLAVAAEAPEKRLHLATPGTEQRGTGANDQVLALLRLPDGDLIVGGYEGGQGGVEEGWPRGNAVGFVERRHADGTLSWHRTLDTPASETVDTLALAANGDIVVAGRTTGAFPGQIQRGQVDAYVAVLSADGELQDLLQAGDERPQHPAAVTTTRNGDIVLAGYDDIYIETNYVIDWHNGFLARHHLPRRGRGGSAGTRLRRRAILDRDGRSVAALADPGLVRTAMGLDPAHRRRPLGPRPRRGRRGRRPLRVAAGARRLRPPDVRAVPLRRAQKKTPRLPAGLSYLFVRE